MEWKEEDHERDDQGRFASKGEPPRISIGRDISLSKSEWAVWYKIIGDIRKGEHVPTMRGIKYITIENKIILTGGTFEKPVVERVLVFDTPEDADEYRRRRFGRKNGK